MRRRSQGHCVGVHSHWRLEGTQGAMARLTCWVLPVSTLCLAPIAPQTLNPHSLYSKYQPLLQFGTLPSTIRWQLHERQSILNRFKCYIQSIICSECSTLWYERMSVFFTQGYVCIAEFPLLSCQCRVQTIVWTESCHGFRRRGWVFWMHS